jgi:hypothetical protein
MVAGTLFVCVFLCLGVFWSSHVAAQIRCTHGWHLYLKLTELVNHEQQWHAFYEYTLALENNKQQTTNHKIDGAPEETVR